MTAKPTLVYFNPDYFSQVDDTVLHYLTKDFHVVWFYLYESLQAKSMRYNPEKAMDYADKYGITLEVVDPQMRRRNPKIVMFYYNVAKKINKYNPDVVYSCDILFWSVGRFVIRTKYKVFGIHDAKGHETKLTLFGHIIKHLSRSCRRNMDYFLTFSPNQHDLFKEITKKESKMVGMSYKSFGVSTKTPPQINNGVKILFFGIIGYYKGLDLLIDAIEELNREGVTNLSLTIAGKGDFWKECQLKIKTPSLYSLMVRFIQNDEIPDLMSSHHFLVLPYRSATQSGPLVTALGYGLPIVAPRFGCFTEVYSDSTAILYQSGDLKNALRKASSLTMADYTQLKNSVMVLKEKYSEDTIARNYINAFKEILYGTVSNN